MNEWKQLRKFADDEEFRAYLTGELKLPNADSILQKLTLAAPHTIPFAKGTRRLRYGQGAFYVEACPTPPLEDMGVGKHINIKALAARWQAMAPNIKVTAALDKNMQSAVAMREYEERGVAGIHVRLNPTKLKGPKQVEERVRWVEHSIQG